MVLELGDQRREAVVANGVESVDHSLLVWVGSAETVDQRQAPFDQMTFGNSQDPGRVEGLAGQYEARSRRASTDTRSRQTFGTILECTDQAGSLGHC